MEGSGIRTKSLIHRGVQDRKPCLRSRLGIHRAVHPATRCGDRLQALTTLTDQALDPLRDKIGLSEPHRPCHKFYRAEDTRFVLGARATNTVLCKQGYYYILSKHLSCLAYARH